jgi:hypothetical protein
MNTFQELAQRWGPRFWLSILLLSLLVPGAQASGYTNLSIAVYFRYQEVHSIPANLERFSNQWANVEKQVKVSKVYLETTRNAQLATESDVTTLKKFFTDRGIKASGGLGLTANEPNGFQSYCYSTPADRDKVKAMTEFTARHFDEVILDDFFFSNCKCERCIEAKGGQTWTQFRTRQMDDVSRDLIIGPARAVNPKVRLIIKYPNWYESFQGLGYDLAVQPKLFDAIYTGTETRDANFGQRLQSYQSYLQTQYFNNIKPGGNAGGWIDGGRDVERYAEQMWDTFFAKVPEITLFNSMQIAVPLNAGNRAGDADTNASLNLSGLVAPLPQADGSSYTPNMVARIAGYSAELLDRFLDKLGKPVGVPAYKPCNSAGEPYLPNYLGMLGIPIDLVPEFPTRSPVVLLTAASRYDPDLVPKVKKFVQAGGRAIATTGLIEALGEKGFQDIVEVSVGGRRVMATRFSSGRFGGSPTPAEPDLNILLPQIRRFENDNRLVINYETALSGYPMAISSTYGQGTFYVVAIPDDFADLYRLPQNVLNQLRSLLCREMFVRLDAPHHVSLFAYDNRTFIVQNFQPQPVNARVSLLQSAKLHDLLSGQTITATQNAEPGSGFGGGARGGLGSGGPSFAVPVPAHSFRVFAAE